MRQPDPSILFVSHDASRTGAPIVLLSLLKWLRANTGYGIEVLLGNGGALEPEFASIAPTATANAGAVQHLDRLSRVVPPSLSRTIRNKRVRSLTRHRNSFDLVYSNTLQNGALLRPLWQPGTPVVSHVHELGWWLTHRTSPDELRFTKSVTDQYVACSRATLDNLVETEGVPRDRVALCHAFIDIDEAALARARADRHVTRQRLGIPPDALVVGGVGTMDWRKGTDIFVQLAGLVSRRMGASDVYFVWVGGTTDGPVAGGLQWDARALGLEERFMLTGPLDRPADVVAAMDLFALTSREDPFPLVMLEAAAAGLPFVCFDRSGGAGEFAVPDAGEVVAYLDVAAMAEVVVRLLERGDERQRMGAVGSVRVRQRHTVDRAGPALVEVIERCLHRPAGRP